MKKLLAIVLCVMMFASFTVNAFASYDATDQRKWESASQTGKIVEALKTNVNNMYGTIAADTAVYQGIKSIDDMLDSLVKEMMKDYTAGSRSQTFLYRDGTGAIRVGSPTGGSSDDIKDAVMAGLRATVGGTITDYMTKHRNDFYKTDSNGQRVFDAAAYAGAFAKAATEAVASEKAVAGIQSYMYYILQRSTFEKVADQLSTLSSDINAWEHWDDYGFDSQGHTPVVGVAAGAGVRGGTNGDNLMQNVFATYQEFLTVEDATSNNAPGGMVGVDLDRNGRWEVGLAGDVDDILLGNIPVFVGDANENVVTPLQDNNGLTPNAVN